MTAKELAVYLNGLSYDRELPRQIRQKAAESGLVAVFGYFDNGMEFVGAIEDGIPAFGGTTVYINESGILHEPYEHCVKGAWSIKAIWHDEGEPCWTYETDIPHEKFLVFKNDEYLFCEGIVFSLECL